MDACYANTLGDCSSKLSKEHYISKKILEFAQPDIGRILLSDTQRACSAKNLANKKMLCSRHNSQLSPIDAEMLKLVTTVFKWNSDQTPTELKLDGTLITRWLFKYGIGILIAEKKEIQHNSYMLQKDWLEILFGRQPFPDWCGFETSGPAQIFKRSEFKHDAPPWVTSLLTMPNGRYIGAQIGVYPLEIFATFTSSPSQISRSFRMGEIILQTKNNDKNAKIFIDWPQYSAKGMKIHCQ